MARQELSAAEAPVTSYSSEEEGSYKYTECCHQCQEAMTTTVHSDTGSSRAWPALPSLCRPRLLLVRGQWGQEKVSVAESAEDKEP